MRYTQLTREKCASGINPVHEIIGLHGQFQSAGQVDGGGVVYEDVDTPETLESLGDGRFDWGFETDVAFYGQSLTLRRN